MAMALTDAGRNKNGKRLYLWTETGLDDTQLDAAFVADGNPYRLVSVSVTYSATPTQAGVTTALDSGAGSGYDTTLNTGSANAQYTTYTPAGDFVLGAGDGLAVTAPAGGSGITASVAIYLEDA